MDERFYEKMYQANVKLSDENTLLKDYIKELERKIDKAKEYTHHPSTGILADALNEVCEILEGDYD